LYDAALRLAHQPHSGLCSKEMIVRRRSAAGASPPGGDRAVERLRVPVLQFLDFPCGKVCGISVPHAMCGDYPLRVLAGGRFYWVQGNGPAGRGTVCGLLLIGYSNENNPVEKI
jgi:hypothetical protein